MNATVTRPYYNHTQVLLEDEHGRVIEQYQEVLPVGTITETTAEVVHHRAPRRKSRIMTSIRAQWRKIKNYFAQRPTSRNSIEMRPLLEQQVVEVLPPSNTTMNAQQIQPIVYHPQEVLVVRQQDVTNAAISTSLVVGSAVFIGICGLLLLLLLL